MDVHENGNLKLFGMGGVLDYQFPEFRDCAYRYLIMKNLIKRQKRNLVIFVSIFLNIRNTGPAAKWFHHEFENILKIFGFRAPRSVITNEKKLHNGCSMRV